MIKVKTSLVSVPVIVSDKQGRYIPDLTQSEFSILQDGKVQKIDFFATSEEPMNAALLIDTSQSTRNVLGDIKSAANKFIKLLQPNDKAMIASFDYSTHVLCSLTSDQDQLRRAVSSAHIPDDFGTTLRDAVAETVRNQFAGVTGRKAIILLTDGKDHGSYVSAAGANRIASGGGCYGLHRIIHHGNGPSADEAGFWRTAWRRCFWRRRQGRGFWKWHPG